MDPMLGSLYELKVATGGTASKAVEVLLDQGVREDHIIFINLVSCHEGIEAITTRFPKLRVITAAIDDELNEKKYIVPGLGDFGCRYFGTER